ncbi:hypothetical protein [Priestia megaterium]|uniref:hypothetical protein n=1 Tax=Priestia megaterium TaxID=1404 RepID=UPI002E1CC55E|nr:hypothetical protein [Priestia megaterium]
MKKCYRCGCIFHEDEAGRRGEYDSDVHATQYFMVCPDCFDDYCEEDEEDEES